MLCPFMSNNDDEVDCKDYCTFYNQSKNCCHFLELFAYAQDLSEIKDKITSLDTIVDDIKDKLE